MNRIMKPALKRITVRGLLLAACIIPLALQPFTASPAVAATTLSVLWTAGGLSAGTDSAGQAARIATDASGNVAVVSGPSGGRDLAVTSYTATGSLRWRGVVSPASGTFVGDWVVAAPNGDYVAVGHNLTSRGQPIAITMVRYASDGTLLWRLDLARTLPSVARLLVDAAGNAYLAFNSVGDGQDIQLHKYNTSGVLLWSQVIASSPLANDIATSLALSRDETAVVVTGDISGGATWITAAYDAATGANRWLVTAAEGIAARDVVVDASRVYVAGAGNVGIAGYLTVVAYDRATGARLWRTDRKPLDSTGAAGLRISKAPDGSLVVAGQAARGFLDWYTVAFETTGTVRWEAVRDGGLNTDEVPTAVLVLADGTTVVTGPGGPNLPGGYIQGVTAGYSANGTLLWEAFSRMATTWATALPNSDVCASGGYDALITCWRVSGVVVSTPSPTPGPTNTPVPPTPSSTPVPPTATATPAPSTNTGFLPPSANAAQTSNAGDNNGYQASPAGAYAADASFAIDTKSGTNTNTSCTDNGKDKHAYYNYNFNLPATALIEGIEVRLDARADATSGAPKICVQISSNGGSSWTNAKSTAALTTNELTYILGGASDTWGRAWSVPNFANVNFRVRLINVSSSPARDFFLDWVAVKVYYRPSAAVAGSAEDVGTGAEDNVVDAAQVEHIYLPLVSGQ